MQKSPEKIQFIRLIYALPYARIPLLYQPPAKLTCNLCSCGAANICLMLTTLLHASVKAQETPGLLPQHLPSTHFTPPVPHMNNTSSDSLHGVNESIASRASETLMAAPAPPPLCLCSTRHQMSTVQSDELWATILSALLPCHHIRRRLHAV